MILGIDTSTSAIAVGLSDGSRTIASLAMVAARGHSEHLAPLVQELLRDNGIGVRDLSSIIVGNGPGPFTGLRVGMVTGLTMGHALRIPVHGLCSLDALAAQAMYAGFNEPELLVATDARRKEVYWARYGVRPSEDEIVIMNGPRREAIRSSGPHVSLPADLPVDVRALPTVGRGAVLFPEQITGPWLGIEDVDAGVLATIAATRLRAGESLPVEPLYLRRPDALTTAERAAR